MKFSTVVLSFFALASAVTAAPIKRTSGIGTFFYQRGNPGACGQYHSDSDKIVAVSSAQYKQGVCGRKVWVAANGKTVQAIIADECPSCNWGDLDLSVGTFKALQDNLGAGTVNIQWDLA